MNKNVEMLERVISAYINSKYVEVPPTEEEFRHVAELMRKSNEVIMPVSDNEFKGILARLKQRLVILMDIGIYIRDRNNGHQSWLPAKRANFDFFFWNRYKTYLEEVKGWNPRLTSNLGKISEEILDLCGDPSADHNFAVKGLVLGDVQSGKTANYTAICNKAADTGYRIIIVLAGLQENLRRQTQERLDAEFSGRRSEYSEYYLDLMAEQGIRNLPVGVGRYGTDKRIASFTSVTRDFNSNVIRACSLGVEDVNSPVLLVVKKNKKILKNLIKWLSDNNERNALGKIDIPLLLIDDEADNASINTRDPDTTPTAINDCIRELLLLFSKTTYLGITATPFANIFIDPGSDEDLFPADFIYTLSAPTNYIGAERIFGDNADRSNMLMPIDMNEFEICFPPKHKKDFKVNNLPEDLYEAAYYFLLINAVRDIRGDKEHRSMMVHISLYTNVQKQIADIMLVWLDHIKSDLRNYSQLPAVQAEEIDTISRLHKVWDKYFSVDCNIEWQKVLQDYLYDAVAPIDVRAVNMRTGPASLDYFNHRKDGLRIIAVGGNSLSRGLTLEGLCVAYFHRNTKMYDTLMQMGRWFGYRPNYDDLVKVWMSDETVEWYQQITSATEELKEDIIRMRNAQQTPREFGLRVRQDPGALIVTARNKMRTAQRITCPIAVSGYLLETPRLKASKHILVKNERVFKEFVNSLSENGQRVCDIDRTKGHYYWECVPNDMVTQLLRDFDTHPWHLRFNGRALSEFIENHQWSQGWDVVLICKGEGDSYPGGLKCGNEILTIEGTEKRHISVDDKMLSVSGTKVRVGSGGCTKIGLTKEEIERAEALFRQETESRKRNVPDRAYLIKERPPILMLHILQADYREAHGHDMPPFLYALGVGFPKNDKDTETVNYVVNLVELRNWTEIPDDSDEEDWIQ